MVPSIHPTIPFDSKNHWDLYSLHSFAFSKKIINELESNNI